jgi:hypothetical protein
MAGDLPFYSSKPPIVRIALSIAVVALSIAIGLAAGIFTLWAIPGIPIGDGGLMEMNMGAPFLGMLAFVFVTFTTGLVGLLFLWRS